MSVRLNARIDDELARKVKYLRKRTQKSTTEVVKASIEAYYRQVSVGTSAAELLSTFVGSATGDANLSTDYKAELSRSLTRKARR
jgi:predicted DNA-binding protein